VTSRVIAIAGAKGSPGCSFVAVALARCLSAARISTVLLDADAERGGVASWLDPYNAVSSESARQIEANLWFVDLVHGDEGSPNGLEIAAAARAEHQAVVVDLGHSHGAVQRQLSAASDWLLWVVVPDRSGLERADRVLESGVLAAASVGLVINRIRQGSLERADEVLSSRHRLPVMARIKDDSSIADRLSHGLRVDRGWGFRRTLHRLARSVHPDAGGRSLPWR
jgi:MinD superfamily P-loop ATPase